MNEQVELPGSSQPSQPNEVKVSLPGKPIEGSISKSIGSGEHARNSFIWITIRYSFVIAGLITAGLYVKSLTCQTSEFALMEGIKAVWAVFMPVITLALGYAFGKGR